MLPTAAGDDEYYYDDDGFDNYVPKNRDPGPWMLFGVCLYSFLCILILPVAVFTGRKRERRRIDHERWKEEDEQLDDDSVLDFRHEGHPENIEVELCDSSIESQSMSEMELVKNEKFMRHKEKYNESVVESGMSAMSGNSNNSYKSSSIGKRHRRSKKSRAGTRSDLYQRAMESEDYIPVEKYKIGGKTSESLGFKVAYSNVFPRKKKDTKPATGEYSDDNNSTSKHMVDDILPEHAADADDPGLEKTFLVDGEDDSVDETICCGPKALFSRRSLKRSMNGLVSLANPDKESRRLLKLGIPLTMSAVFESLFEAICVALISNYLGVEALSAFVVAETLLSLSDTLIGGVADTLNTLCSHAIGTSNYNLAGQYVQIATLIYLVAAVPFFGIWWFFMADCIRLFGMNEDVVQMGADYTKVAIFDYALEGVADSYSVLLDISGYAYQATIYDMIAGAMDCVVLWVLLATVDDFDLFWTAVAMLLTNFVFFVIFTIIVVCNGWLDPYWDGMLKTFAFKNKVAVKNVIETAIPLSIGSLLEYGEWEALTFFAAYLGPAEVAAWGILESIWDLFESATEGLSESGAIRLAYNLGKGNVEGAKASAWKSLFLSTVLAIFISSVLFLCGSSLPRWFTSDETLQNMLNPIIPLIGIGNILMIFGMVSWSLVGAQGRYKLATIISAIMTFCVTIPLAFLFVIGNNINLQGLVAAVVISYSTTGLVLGYILLTSDWEHISKTIRDYNEAENISLGSEDSDESSSSSSSSSSSDSSIGVVSLGSSDVLSA